jgi:hypothetical protein
LKPDDKSLERLLAAARRAPAPGGEPAPFGFSTRVAALAFEARPSEGYLFARLSLRAAAVAGLLACAAVAANYAAIRSAFQGDPPAPAAAVADDPIAEVVDAASS